MGGITSPPFPRTAIEHPAMYSPFLVLELRPFAAALIVLLLPWQAWSAPAEPLVSDPVPDGLKNPWPAEWEREFQARGERVLNLRLPLSDGATLAWLYAHGQVLSRQDHELGAELRVRLNHADAARLERRLGHNGGA